MSVNHRARSGGTIGIFFSILLKIKVCYVFSLESPHRMLKMYFSNRGNYFEGEYLKRDSVSVSS